MIKPIAKYLLNIVLDKSLYPSSMVGSYSATKWFSRYCIVRALLEKEGMKRNLISNPMY